MSRETRAALTALLRNGPVDWSSLATADGRALLDAALDEGVACLLSRRLRQYRSTCPANLVGFLDGLRQVTRKSAVRERCSLIEVRDLLGRLAQAGVPVLLMKGVPLASTHYPEPWLRPHTDYDLLVRHEDVDRARRVLSTAGYGEPLEFPGQRSVPANLFCGSRDERFQRLAAVEGIWHGVVVHGGHLERWLP